jgi:hypothetical protein
MNHDHRWMDQHYALVGLRCMGAAAILLVVLALCATTFVALSRQPAEERQERTRTGVGE